MLWCFTLSLNRYLERIPIYHIMIEFCMIGGARSRSPKKAHRTPNIQLYLLAIDFERVCLSPRIDSTYGIRRLLHSCHLMDPIDQIDYCCLSHSSILRLI